MRFHFLKTEVARRLAKALRAELALLAVILRNTESQSLFARMYGYRDWAELVRITGTVPPSPPDEACSPEVRAARHAQRIRVLCELVSPEQAEEILSRVIRPRGKGKSKISETPSGLVWEDKGDALFAVSARDPRFKEVYRISAIGPADGQRTRSYELRAGFEHLMATSLQPFSVVEGVFPTIEEAMDEADWSVLCEDPQIWPSGKWIEKDRNHSLETPWGGPDELWHIAEGIIRVEAGSTSAFRVDPAVMREIPEALRVRTDTGGYGWYANRQRTLLATALPQHFGVKARRFAALDLKRSFPAVAAVLATPFGVSAAVMRRAQREIVAGEEDERGARGQGLAWARASQVPG